VQVIDPEDVRSRVQEAVRELILLMCEWLTDLSPLADSTVVDLALHRVDKADLSGLRDVPLQRLRIQHPGLTDRLHPLPATLPLRELTVDNQPTNRSLLGIERWTGLERVSFAGAPNADETAALATLPALRRLVITRVDPVDHLAELTKPTWPALRTIELPDLDDEARRAAVAILAAISDVEVV
jgi:hypothetical protein